MMRLFTALSMIVSLGLAPYSLRAATYDGSAPLLCALTEVIECEVAHACQRTTAAHVHLPPFIKVNLTEKTLVGADHDAQEAAVESVQHANGRLVMQGGKEGRGWSLVILGETGQMSAVVADGDGAFVIFGACTSP
jgi:hypothetical protein